MGLIHFQPSRKSDPGFDVREFPVEASATFTIGAPLQRDSSNKDECEEHAGSSTVTGIIGVAMQAVATAGVPDFGSKVQVAVASKDVEYIGQIYDTGESVVATILDDGTYEGKTFGFIKVSGNWYLDEDDTSDVVAIVTKEMPGIGGAGAVLFKFIASAIGE